MKLPVWRTTLDVFDFIWNARRAALRFGLPPVLILFVATVALALALDATKQSDQAAMAVITLALQAIVFLPVTVTWYRLVVHGETEASARPVFAFGKQEWRLLGWQVLILLIVGVIGVVCAFISGRLYLYGTQADSTAILIVDFLWTFAWAVAVLITLTRLSMVLALAALDQPVSLKAAWHMTRGIAGNLFTVTALIGLGSALIVALFKLAGFVVGAITALATDSALADILKALGTMGETIGTLVSLLGVATLFGFVYKKLEEAARSATEPPA